MTDCDYGNFFYWAGFEGRSWSCVLNAGSLSVSSFSPLLMALCQPMHVVALPLICHSAFGVRSLAWGGRLSYLAWRHRSWFLQTQGLVPQVSVGPAGWALWLALSVSLSAFAWSSSWDLGISGCSGQALASDSWPVPETSAASSSAHACWHYNSLATRWSQ